MSIPLGSFATRTAPQGPGVSPSARAAPSALGGIARGTADLARASEVLVRADQQRQRDREAIWVARTAAEQETYWFRNAAAREQESALDGEGHLESLQQDFEDHVQGVLDQAPSDDARAALELQLTHLGGRLSLEAADFEARAHLDAQAIELGRAVTALANATFVDPAGYENRRAELRGLVGGLEAPDTTKAKLLAENERALALAAGQGALEADPGGIIGRLKEGWLEHITADDRARLINRAEAEEREVARAERQRRAEAERRMRERQRVERAALNVAMANSLARVRTGHEAEAPPWQDFHSAYGEEGATAAYEAFTRQLVGAEQVAALAAMPKGEIERRVADMPDPSDPHYAELIELHQATREAAEHILDARSADPAGYVLQTNSGVRDLFGRLEEPPTQHRPDLERRAQEALLAEQQRLQIPAQQRRAWPMALVEREGQAIMETADAQARAAQLASLVLRTPQGPARRNLLADLEQAGLPAGIRFLVPAIEAGDRPGVASALSALEADLKLDGDARKRLDGLAVSRRIDEVAALTGMLTGDARLLEEGRRQSEAVYALAGSLTAGGMRPRPAWDRAAEILGAGRQQIADESLAAVYVPRGIDVEDVETGLERTRDRLPELLPLENVRDMLLGATDPGAIGAAKAGEIADTKLEALVRDWRTTGVWLEAADGYRLQVQTPFGPRWLPGLVLSPEDAARIGGTPRAGSPVEEQRQENRERQLENVRTQARERRERGGGVDVNIGWGPGADPMFQLFDRLGRAVLGDGQTLTPSERQAARHGRAPAGQEPDARAR